MTWKVEWDNRARKELRHLDQTTQRRILQFTAQRVSGEEDPQRLAHSLSGSLSDMWSFRVGSYRLICYFRYEDEIVRVLKVRHRRDVYSR